MSKSGQTVKQAMKNMADSDKGRQTLVVTNSDKGRQAVVETNSDKERQIESVM